jgi:hypothetical protein
MAARRGYSKNTPLLKVWTVLKTLCANPAREEYPIPSPLCLDISCSMSRRAIEKRNETAIFLLLSNYFLNFIPRGQSNFCKFRINVQILRKKYFQISVCAAKSSLWLSRPCCSFGLAASGPETFGAELHGRTLQESAGMANRTE